MLSLLAVLFIISFLFFDLLSAHPSAYIGLWTYLILPGLLVIGLAAIVLGLLTARRRFRRQAGAGPAEYYPRIDLNLASHRRVLAAVGVVVALALPVVGLMSYRGYHYTDSNEFCGRVCHEVMEPQYTAYLRSPHARVACAECHIGAGASWYVKSKLSGLRQVWAVATDSFPRPIPTAIHELRPASETCRQCHWPAKFFGDQLMTIDRFESDEANTHRQIRMFVKTGGNDPSSSPPSGIHWHMALGFKIEFVAVDDELQDIRWTKVTDYSTGRQTVYRSDGRSSKDPPPQGRGRVVDCMDCHNRPTHIFRSADQVANQALNVNPQLQSLPYAKRRLVESLVPPYSAKDAGLTGVASMIKEFYRDQYPQVYATRRQDVDRLVEAARTMYRTNFFPAMRASWRTYPNNIGHMEFDGCFRCHDGRHVTDQGKVLRNECHICHTFLTQPDPQRPNLVQEGDFTHPVPLEGLHATLRCTSCHDGGPQLPPTCAGCHAQTTALRTAQGPPFERFGIGPEPMLDLDCADCHDLTGPLSPESLDATCTGCHDPEEDERFDGLLAFWDESTRSRLESATAAVSKVRRLIEQSGDRSAQGALRQWLAQNEPVLELLRKAGPLHNYQASIEICRQLTTEAEELTASPSQAKP